MSKHEKVNRFVDFYASNGLTADDTGIGDWGPSLTRQEFADECDINVIMERYETTGVISHVMKSAPMYVDYMSVPDNLIDAMATMMDADKAFMSLPAKVRKEFDNNAMRFVEFAQNPANLDQMRKWDLAPPAKQEPPPAAPASAPAPAVAVAEVAKE